MRIHRTILLALSALIITQSGGWAEENIVRLSSYSQDNGFMKVSHEAQVNAIYAFGQAPRPDLSGVIFTVYTKEEIDARRAQDRQSDEQALSEMREVIKVLRQDIKALADLNDSLSKRLEEVEKKTN